MLLAAFLFCALAGRLVWLQVVRGRDLQARAVDQWTRDLPLQAVRGSIVDCEERVLASSRTAYTVYVRPRAVRDAAATAGLLAEVLDLDYDLVYGRVTRRASEVTIAKAVPKEQILLLKDSGLDGILFGETSARVYPYGDWLSRVLGFTNIDSEGATGLELYYEDYLKGVDGRALTQTDLVGIPTGAGALYLPSVPGMTLVTAIDAEIQRLAEWTVADALAKYEPKSASCIVTDVTDGGIVAMATAPSFDLNAPPRDDIASLNALSKNLLLTDVYEPGSTFKIFTTAAALEEGLTNEKDTFYCPGYRMVDGQRIRCWKSAGHGTQTLAEGVQNSCNCVFMDLAQRLGTQRLYAYLGKFGFGSESGVDFAGESKGIMMAESRVKTVDLARIGFGQAVAVTPVQVMAGVSAAVNGGMGVTPHFAERAVTENGTTVRLAPVRSDRVISASTSKLLSDMLERVVSQGGGKNAQVEGYRIGGKTGTAQKYADGHIAQGKYVSSFVGFAPVESPRYAVMILVDEPQGWVYYGSQVAAPYAAKVFKGIFDYKGIEPTVKGEPIERTVMPDLVGLPLTSAAGRLAEHGLSYEVAGESGRVVDQVPAPGAFVRVHDTVAVRLG